MAETETETAPAKTKRTKKPKKPKKASGAVKRVRPEKKPELVVVEGVQLTKRHPVGWRTLDGRYDIVEVRRGSWEAYDVAGATRVHVATGGTRGGAVARLAKIIAQTYTGPLPYVTG